MMHMTNTQFAGLILCAAVLQWSPAAAAPASSAAAKEAAMQPKITWQTIATCQSLRDALPGQGLFFARAKLKDGFPLGVEVRGCGTGRKVRRWRAFEVNDPVNLSLYAVPFYRPGHYDFVLSIGWDDVPDYVLFAEKDGYKAAFEFSTTQGIYFGEAAARDGRWAIHTAQIETFNCKSGRQLREEEYPTLIDADDVCKPAR